MKKMYDIPIYAIRTLDLEKRVNKCIDKARRKTACIDTRMAARVVDLETFPMRCWQYNHIIGYISISLSEGDVLFEVFLPVPLPERYRWKGTKKHYVQNVQTNGTHFSLDRMKVNDDVCYAIAKMLDHVVENHIPKHYFVDREAFDTMNMHTNYMAIIESNSERKVGGFYN